MAKKITPIPPAAADFSPAPPAAEAVSTAANVDVGGVDEDDDDESHDDVDLEMASGEEQPDELDMVDDQGNDLFDQARKEIRGLSGRELGLMKKVARAVAAKKPDLNIRFEKEYSKQRRRDVLYAVLPSVKAIEAVFKASRVVRPVFLGEMILNVFGGVTNSGRREKGFAPTLADILKYHPELGQTTEVKAVQLLLSEVYEPKVEDKGKKLLDLQSKGEMDFRIRRQKISKAMGVVKSMEHNTIVDELKELGRKIGLDADKELADILRKPFRFQKRELLAKRRSWLTILKSRAVTTVTSHEDPGFHGSPRQREGGVRRRSRRDEYEQSERGSRRVVLTSGGHPIED